MGALKHIQEKINISGYDNELSLIRQANGMNPSSPYVFKHKDIVELTTEDIVSDSLLYLYEPIYDKELCLEFIDNLCSIMHKGQYILCKNTSKSVGFSYEILLTKSDMQYLGQVGGVCGAVFIKK